MSDSYTIRGNESEMTPGLQVFRKHVEQTGKAPKVRVAAYCRVSTNLEIQQSSLEVQISSYRRIIREHPGWKLAGIYTDKGLSGTGASKRVQFQRMIEDAKAGKIDYIIAKSTSRFARNTVDTLSYTRMLKEMGVGVYFEEQKIDTANIASEMLLTIHAAFAQEESHSISENLKKGVRSRFAMGIPKWSETYGLRRTGPDVWEPYEPEAAVVRRIFSMYLDGMKLPVPRKCCRANGSPLPDTDPHGHPADRPPCRDPRPVTSTRKREEEYEIPWVRQVRPAHPARGVFPSDFHTRGTPCRHSGSYCARGHSTPL